MRRDEQIKQILEDFVFMDCRLGDHPKVQSAVFRVVGDNLVSAAHSSGGQSFADQFSIPVKNSIAGFVAEQKRVYRISDVQESYSRYVSFLTSIKSELAVPIIVGADAIGVLLFDSVDANAFQEKHLGRAQVLAAVIAYISSRDGISLGVRSTLSESLSQALRSIRQELGLTQEELAHRIGTSRIALSRWESGAQPPSYGPLCRWCQALGLLQRKGRAQVTTIDVTPELLNLLRRDPEQLHGLSPDAFENVIGESLCRMGFDVQKTGSTSLRDGGIDFVAIPKVRTVATHLMAVQVKHHAKGTKTGRAPVDRLLSWKDSSFRFGLLVTNTGFTRDALWTALQARNRDFLRLRDFSDLKRWIEGNFWSPEEWRELPSQIEVSPGIVIDIPKAELKSWYDIWPLESEENGNG